jgi:hypothetical protein
VLLFLGLIAELLVTMVRALLALFGPRGAPPTITQFDQLLKDLQQDPNPESSWLRFLAYLILGLLVAAVGGSILLWLASALGRRGFRFRDRDDEDRESVWTEGALAADLKDLANAMLRRLVRRKWSPLDGLGNDPRGVLLRTYYLLLELGQERGTVRPSWQTPAEFQPALAGTFPDGEPQVVRITRGFLAARYDPAPPPAETAAGAEQDLETLRRPPADSR